MIGDWITKTRPFLTGKGHNVQLRCGHFVKESEIVPWFDQYLVLRLGFCHVCNRYVPVVRKRREVSS